MARGDYGPEIKGAMGGSPPGKPRTTPPTPSPMAAARDVGAGVKPNEPPAPGGSPMQRPPGVVPVGARPPGAGMPPDVAHVAAATSIAHAILNRAGGGGRPM